MFSISISRNSIMAALAVSTILTAASCNKDDKPGNDNSKQKKIAKLALDNDNYIAYTYSSDNKLAKIKTKFQFQQGPILTETDFIYEGGKLKETRDNDGVKTVFIYDGALLKRSEEFDETGEKTSYEEFNSYSNGRITQITSYVLVVDNSFVPESRTTFEYYANGNLKQTKIYSYLPDEDKFEIQSRTEYLEYDDKFNPLAFMESVNFLTNPAAKVNNPRLINHFNENDALYQSVENVYVYDAEGFPTEVTTTEKNSGQAPYVEKRYYTYTK